MFREDTRQAEPTLLLFRSDFCFTTRLLISTRCSRANRSRLLGFVFCLQVKQTRLDCNEDGYKLTQQRREVVPSSTVITLKSNGHLSSDFQSLWINIYLYRNTLLVCKTDTSFHFLTLKIPVSWV